MCILFFSFQLRRDVYSQGLRGSRGLKLHESVRQKLEKRRRETAGQQARSEQRLGKDYSTLAAVNTVLSNVRLAFSVQSGELGYLLHSWQHHASMRGMFPTDENKESIRNTFRVPLFLFILPLLISTRSKLRVMWKHFDCFAIYLKDTFIYKIKQLLSLI